MPEGFNNSPGVVQSALDNVVGGNLSGIFSTKATAKYATGARCVLRINGQVCGFAFGVSWRINTDQTEITTIDDYLPHELAPRRITVDGSLSMLHIPGQGATAMLYQSDVLSFLFQKYISIEVRDSQTDQLLFSTAKAVVTSRSEDLRVDALDNVTLTWKAIGWVDERPPGIDDQNKKADNTNELFQAAFDRQNIA